MRPASVTVIAGDIHHSYLAEVALPGATAVYQAVCSPMHNVMPERLRLAHRLITSGAGGLIARAAARLAGVRAPRARWRVTDGPWFGNMAVELSYQGRAARIRFSRTAPGGADAPGLVPACERELTRGA